MRKVQIVRCCWCAGGQDPVGDIVFQLGGDLARRDGAGGIGVDEYLEHHPRLMGLLAPAGAFVRRIERVQVKLVHQLADEIRQMVIGQPVMQARGQ